MCLKGDHAAAAEVLAEATHLFNDIQLNCGAHILETSAAWAAMTGRFELGAELLGAAGRIREDTGDKPRPWEHVVQEEYLPRIRADLDPSVFADAHARGARKEFREALAFAEHSLRTAITK